MPSLFLSVYSDLPQLNRYKNRAAMDTAHGFCTPGTRIYRSARYSSQAGKTCVPAGWSAPRPRRHDTAAENQESHNRRFFSCAHTREIGIAEYLGSSGHHSMIPIASPIAPPVADRRGPSLRFAAWLPRMSCSGGVKCSTQSSSRTTVRHQQCGCWPKLADQSRIRKQSV